MIWLVVLKHQAFEAHEWLCEAHIAAWREIRDERGHLHWMQIEQVRALPEGYDCAGCERERQAAPGYVTPTPDFVPTGPESRLLAREAAA